VCAMSKAPMKKYPAEFKERAVKLAVETEQPIAQTARDLGVNENTLHTWIGKYHRAERQEPQVHDEHLYEELKRLRTENTRLKEERDILKKAAAYFAQQLP
jgi:transposase